MMGGIKTPGRDEISLVQPSVRSVERAVDLLLTLEQAGHPMRLSELARAAGIHIATAQRLLSVLERRGLVEKESARYRVGLATVPLAYAFYLGNDLTKVALPVLQALSAATGQTCSLFLRLGLSRVVVQRVEGKHPLRFVLTIGQRLPLYLGAGKVLAAAMSKQELDRLLNQIGEMRLATGQVRTKEAFLAELKQIRKQGFAVSINERTMGVASVAAPIVQPGGTTVAAISAVGPVDKVPPDRIPQLSVDVRRAAQAIAERALAIQA